MINTKARILRAALTAASIGAAVAALGAPLKWY